MHRSPSQTAFSATTLERERIPYEIVVVDDGSTDETPSRVGLVMARYPTVSGDLEGIAVRLDVMPTS